VSGRKALESSVRQLEREKALLQHKSLESQRKAESEADRKRCLENEGEAPCLYRGLVVRSICTLKSEFPSSKSEVSVGTHTEVRLPILKSRTNRTTPNLDIQHGCSAHQQSVKAVVIYCFLALLFYLRLINV